MDKRIGKRTENAIEWPETSILGRPYARNWSQIGLPNGHFAILDTFINRDEQDALVAELSAIVSKTDKKAAKHDSE